jgi:hypothetical protein
MSNDLTVRGRMDLALPDFGEDYDDGFQNQTGDDIVLPFLSVLQALSPQVQKEVGQGGVEGAKAGMLFNTVTGEIFSAKEGLLFVPAVTQHVFVEWVPRKAGGGFVAMHEPDAEIIVEAKEKSTSYGKYSTQYDSAGEPIGNDLVETFYVYGVLCIAEGQNEPVVLPFTSTKIKKYKTWNTKTRLFTVKTAKGPKNPPMYANLVRITGVADRNKKGDFFNFNLAPALGTIPASLLDPTDERFIAAKEVGAMIKSGAARASFETQNADGGAEASTGDSEAAPF